MLERIKSNHSLLFLLVAAITVSRNISILSHPSFYAEDGTVFFRDAIDLGVRSLWLPIGGQHIFLSRLVAFFTLGLPVYWIPTAYGLFSISLFCWSVCLFYRPGFRWLVPEDRIRAFLVIAISLTAGSAEISSAICLIYYTLTLATGLLLLEKSDENTWRLSFKTSILLLPLFFSCSIAGIYLPLIVVLWFITSRKEYLFVFAALLLSVILNFSDALRYTTGSFYNIDSKPNLALLLDVTLTNGVIRLLIDPLGGPLPSRYFAELPSVIFFGLAVPFAFAVLLFCRALRFEYAPERRLFVLFLALLFCTVPMVCISRPYGLGIFTRPNFCPNLRYSFLCAAGALLFWGTFSVRGPIFLTQRRWRTFLLAMCAFNLALADLMPQQAGYIEVNRAWRGSAQELQQILNLRNARLLHTPAHLETIICRPQGWVEHGIRNWTIQPLREST